MHLTTSDDYAYMENSKLSFYYGYEETYCEEHNAFNCECEDYEQDYCFVVKDIKTGKEIYRTNTSEIDEHFNRLDDMNEYLLAGICMFIEKRNKANIKEVE